MSSTAWNWAFNIYDEPSFTKEDFSTALYAFIQREGGAYAKKMVEKEFDCFKNTYVSDQAFSVSKIIDEDTVPFFAPLKLIEYKGSGRFERRKIHAKDVPLDICFACILLDNQEYLNENRQIGIDLLLEGDNQVGKYMNLSYSALLELLQQLDNKNYIRLVNNFGNRYIEVHDHSATEILEAHYHAIGR